MEKLCAVLHSILKEKQVHNSPDLKTGVFTTPSKPKKILKNTNLKNCKAGGDALVYDEVWKNNVHRSTDKPRRTTICKNTNCYRRCANENAQLKKIDCQNITLGYRLLNIKAVVKTRENVQNNEKNVQISQKTLDKYKNIVSRTERRLLAKLLRPNIVFQLEVQDMHPIGPVTAQLFTEACPALVLALARLCGQNKSGRWKLTRIFHNLWTDSIILLDQSSPLTQGCLEHDMYVLDQASNAGVFSFEKQYLNGFKSGYAHFSISFRPITTLEGRRVPFGIITNGMKAFDILQEYGTKNGNILKKITVTKCDMFF